MVNARALAVAAQRKIEIRLPSLDTLSALAWLVDAGADEAIGESSIDRFQAKGIRRLSATAAEGRSPLLNEVVSGAAAPSGPRVTPTSVLNAYAHDNDHIGRAMETASACASLPKLKEALEGFEGCALKQFANTTVFADGNADARIMFIGEAPGYEEDRTGLPFVGRAGKLLDKMLAAIGLDRTSAYIINVLPWRPPDNRNPDLAEVAKCIPFLRRHIELHAPEVIVLLGASPLRHVLGKTEGILQTRGKWLQYHVGSRMVPVMPTLHPAYLLRQPAHKKLAWRDLLSILDKFEAIQVLER